MSETLHDVELHRPVRLDALDAEVVRREFETAWSLTEWLFSSLVTDEVFAKQPDPLRQPLLFYFAHAPAFYINKLRLGGLRSEALHEVFDELFAKGVDPSDAAELEAFEGWPSLEQVREYRELVRKTVMDVIPTVDWSDARPSNHATWAVLMGLEHERVHFETSSMLIRQLDVHDVRRPQGWRYAATEQPAPAPSWVDVPVGVAELGRSEDLPLYGWDIDFGKRTVDVPRFEASRYLVTNSDFRQFVEAGGYQNPDWWSRQGWAWRDANQVNLPLHWRREHGGFRYRAMFDELPLPDAWPAEVNAYEADAYCRFRGDVRLPTELEWARMLEIANEGEVEVQDANVGLRFGSPTAVSECGSEVCDARGNVWQWTSDPLRPLEGFETHPLYEDWSAAYFDDDHLVMRGGSWATTGAGSSPFYRNWFRRHFAQHAGFRVVRA